MMILKKWTNSLVICIFMLILISLVGYSNEHNSAIQSSNETDTVENSNFDDTTLKADLETDVQHDKTLVIYYSLSGSTKAIAEKLADKMGADLYEVKIDRTYDDDMWKAWETVQAELESGDLPNITEELPDIGLYDTILIGGPVWGRTVSTPILLYMNQTDFAGKAVSGFWTFYSQDEDYNSTMKKSIKNGSYIEGLSLPRSVINDETILDDAMEKWIKTLQ